MCDIHETCMSLSLSRPVPHSFGFRRLLLRMERLPFFVFVDETPRFRRPSPDFLHVRSGGSLGIVGFTSSGRPLGRPDFASIHVHRVGLCGRPDFASSVPPCPNIYMHDNEGGFAYHRRCGFWIFYLYGFRQKENRKEK